MTNTELEAARAVAFRFIGYSPRSSAEIDRRLQKDKYDPAVRQAVIDELIEGGYLDDGKFASDWILDRADRKRYGKARLAAELNRKGVGSDTIKEVIGEISEEDEVRRAIELASTKSPADAQPHENPELTASTNRKLAAYLQRRGFGWSIIKQVLAHRAENSSLLS